MKRDLLRAWVIERDEDTTASVVIAEDLTQAVIAWRQHVADFYGMSAEEAEGEQPRSARLLCDRGEVVLPREVLT